MWDAWMVRIGGDRRSGRSVADPCEASRLVGVTRFGPGGRYRGPGGCQIARWTATRAPPALRIPRTRPESVSLIEFIRDRAQLSLWEKRRQMATYLAFHEVDDVKHWLSSPKRDEVFGPLGITTRTFQDPQGSKRVGMIVEIPDFAAFQAFMQTDPAAEAMKHDGVHADTLVILAEG